MTLRFIGRYRAPVATREELIRLADQADRDAVDLERQAAISREQARELRKLAATAFDTTGVLHKRLRRATVNDVSMHADHRLAISKGQGDEDRAFRKAIRAKGYTQNALAKAVGINQAVLSLHRRELRKIPLARAQRIEALTGWPADAKHWPCGIVSDGE